MEGNLPADGHTDVLIPPPEGQTDIVGENNLSLSNSASPRTNVSNCLNSNRLDSFFPSLVDFRVGLHRLYYRILVKCFGKYSLSVRERQNVFARNDIKWNQKGIFLQLVGTTHWKLATYNGIL